MTEYVRLTFRPHGAKRDRTVWAERIKPNGYSFWVVNREGNRPEPREELVIASARSCTIQPAIMSLKYAWLMLPDDPDLQNEIDREHNPAFRKESA